MTVRIDLDSIHLLGDAIRFHRKKAGLSRVDLADIAGVGKTVIFDLENGKESVRLNTVLKVLFALNISLTLDGPIMHLCEQKISKIQSEKNQ